MRITKLLAKDLRSYIFRIKRKCDIINKQIQTTTGSHPYIVFSSGYHSGFKFTFSTEENMQAILKNPNPTITMYCKIDRGLYMLYEALEYKEITLDQYVDMAVNYISNSMVTVNNQTDTYSQMREDHLKELMYRNDYR